MTAEVSELSLLIGEAPAEELPNLLREHEEELSEEEGSAIIERIRNSQLLDEVMAWLGERLAEEEDRRKIIEGKANTLFNRFSVAGLAVTGFGFTALLKLNLPAWLLGVLAVGLVVTAGLAARSARVSFQVLQVAPTFAPSNAAILDEMSVDHYSQADRTQEDPLGYRISRARERWRVLFRHTDKASIKADTLAQAEEATIGFINVLSLTALGFIVAAVLNAVVG